MRARWARRIPRSRRARRFGSAGASRVLAGRRRGLGPSGDHVRDPARVSWWASWYPGAEPGGGGYVAQNMLACKDERNARRRALLQRRALRDPQLAVGRHRAVLARALRRLGPNAAGAEDPGLNYVQMMVDYLPPGLRGFMLASFAAAYMSTQATQMNWGSSYLINDLYRRFLKRDASERHYVFASRLATALTSSFARGDVFMNQISKVWELLLTLGAGTGLVYILRWYWWRINAWSEVVGDDVRARQSRRSCCSGRTSGPRPATPRGFAMTLRDDGRHDRRLARDDVRDGAGAAKSSSRSREGPAGGAGLEAGRRGAGVAAGEGSVRPQRLVLAPRRDAASTRRCSRSARGC